MRYQFFTARNTVILTLITISAWLIILLNLASPGNVYKQTCHRQTGSAQKKSNDKNMERRH